MTTAVSALYAARLRLRPIIMTATVMVFGILSLVFLSGAGAKGNIAIGASVLGGMFVGTVAIQILVPLLFCLFKHLDERLSKMTR